MTVTTAATVRRRSAGAKAVTMAVADALAMSVQMPEMMTLVFIAMSGGIACTKERERGYADRKHRKLPGSSSSDTDKVTARRA